MSTDQNKLTPNIQGPVVELPKTGGSRQAILPITGMTCANCVATVERSLKKVPGVESASVNLSSERASVTYDPAQADLPALVARVERAGYGVASGTAELIVKRLSDDNDARRLEKKLLGLAGCSGSQRIGRQRPGAGALHSDHHQPAGDPQGDLPGWLRGGRVGR